LADLPNFHYPIEARLSLSRNFAWPEEVTRFEGTIPLPGKRALIHLPTNNR
jgi:hypothetical protein